MLKCVTVFVLFTLAGGIASTDPEISNIRLLHVVFRHGERAPVDTYPNDPHINFTFPPYGWGQLTTVGRENQYMIGQFLRKRYGQFLGDSYHPDIVSVETTGADRSIMSGQLQMAGLWPPAGEQKWREGLAWQPISMKIDPLDSDMLLLVRIPCARYSLELESVLNSTENQDELAPYRDMMEDLEKHSGKQIRSADDVADLYSTLKAEAEYGVALPEWLTGIFPEKMEYLTAYSFTVGLKTPLLKRIKGGPLLKKIIEDSKAAASNTLRKGRKLFLYGGHDSTVVNLLTVLNVWKTQVPVSGIATLIEVHEDPISHEFGLKVFLRNSTASAEPIPLEIPNCGYFCPLGKVEDLYKDLIPDDLVSECKSDDPDYVPPPPKGP